MRSSSSSSKSNEVRHLLIEDERFKVYRTEKIVKGRIVKQNKIYFNSEDAEPRFNIETPGIINCDAYITEINRERQNIAIGLLLQDGTLDVEDVEKRYFLAKLNLIKQKPKLLSLQTTTTEIDSDEDVTRSSFKRDLESTPLSTPPPSDHSSRAQSET